MINSKEEYTKMCSVENNHWWYKSLHCLVLKTIDKNFNTNNISILDAGCGTGGLMDYLKDNKYTNLEGFDLSNEAVKLSISKRLNVWELNLKDYRSSEQRYDVIISNDTMYFFTLKEQKTILNNFYNSLKGEGIVILNLPSFDAFSGIHDKVVGIQERFNSEMIDNMIDKNKFEIIEKKYWPFLLSPIIYLVRFIQNIQIRFNKNIQLKSDIDMPSKFINAILYKIVKFENICFSKKPFGSSLFLVLKRK